MTQLESEQIENGWTAEAREAVARGVHLSINVTNHVGITVPSIDDSIAFYRDVLGMAVLSEGTFGGEQVERIMGVEGATGRVALLQHGNQGVELFEFSNPSPKAAGERRSPSDLGITHFCLEVSDIEAEYERLSAAGVTFHCPPQKFFGVAWCTYARDPDGNMFELVEMPGSRESH